MKFRNGKICALEIFIEITKLLVSNFVPLIVYKISFSYAFGTKSLHSFWSLLNLKVRNHVLWFFRLQNANESQYV